MVYMVIKSMGRKVLIWKSSIFQFKWDLLLVEISRCGCPTRFHFSYIIIFDIH